MRLEGTVNIKAAREKVWGFLTDANQVSQCAPGVESVEIITPNKKFRAVASVGFGAVKAKFAGTGEFVELDAPNWAKIKAHGDAPGSAVDVLSEMTLTDGADLSTDVKWIADVTVVGTIASLASRMMGGITQTLTAEFFNCAKKKIEA